MTRPAQALAPAAHDTFAIFEDLRLSGNGERPHYDSAMRTIRILPFHKDKTFALELVEDRTHKIPRTLPQGVSLLSFNLPIRDLYAAGCPQITLMFTEFRALTLISTPLLLLLLKTLSERSASSLPSAAHVFFPSC